MDEDHMFSPENMGIFDDMIYGAYKMMGRLEDIPLGMNLPEIVYTEGSDPSGSLPDILRDLTPKRMSMGYYTAWYYGNKLEHGGWMKPCMTAEERKASAERGVATIERMAKGFNFPKKLEALRTLDQFTQESILPRYGGWLPKSK
jgi:creatinine amidohydrolase